MLHDWAARFRLAAVTAGCVTVVAANCGTSVSSDASLEAVLGIGSTCATRLTAIHVQVTSGGTTELSHEFPIRAFSDLPVAVTLPQGGGSSTHEADLLFSIKASGKEHAQQVPLAYDYTDGSTGRVVLALSCVCIGITCPSGEFCVELPEGSGKASCQPVAKCGDGICEVGEPGNCPQDCSPTCGNDICNTGDGESCKNCPIDCGACDLVPKTCGNGTCNAGENCSNCAADCCSCADPCCTNPLGACCADPGGACCTDPSGDCCTNPDGACCQSASSVCCTDPTDPSCAGGSCGDGNCDPTEDCGSCPSDCPCDTGSECMGSSCQGVTCMPDCTGQTCGSDDGCGSTCMTDCNQGTGGGSGMGGASGSSSSGTGGSGTGGSGTGGSGTGGTGNSGTGGTGNSGTGGTGNSGTGGTGNSGVGGSGAGVGGSGVGAGVGGSGAGVGGFWGEPGPRAHEGSHHHHHHWKLESSVDDAVSR